MFSGIIRLRRDNDYNYDRIKDVFVPARGEVCLVDTALRGLRAKVGDGKTTYANLEYTDANLYTAIESVVVRGYYKDGEFYLDSMYTKKATASITSIYINVSENNIYTYDGVGYHEVAGQLQNASATTVGVMKLYGETGQHTDGTMTQKAITDELSEKIEIQIDEANETVCFGNW
jgi:hypothetical protein